MEEIIVEIITDLIEAIILLNLFEIFMDEKKFIINNKVRSIIFCIIFATFLFFTSTYIALTYHTLINIIFAILLFIFFTRINAWSAIIICLTFFIILLITEISVSTLEMIVLNVNMEQIVLNKNYLLAFTILSKSLQILIVILLSKFNLSIKKYKIFNSEESIYSNFILSIAVLGIFTIGICYKSDIKNTTIYNTLVFGLYMVFFILAIRDLKERDKLIKIKNKYEVQEFHMKNMNEIISIIKKEKHDYANHINVINGLCRTNKPDAIEKINGYVSEISNSIHNSFKYLNTGNDYIDGLLSIKSNYAMENGIDFQVDISDPLNNLKIKANELTSIISNLVDNAFEAFEDKLLNENKEVFFDACLHDDKYIIEIGNNAERIPSHIIDDIFKKGFSTKGDEESDHGYGLYITKELIEKNHGTITVESDEFETIFTIIFDLKKI